jgi:hypothetical protein
VTRKETVAPNSGADGDGILVLLRLGEVVDGFLLFFVVSCTSTASVGVVLSSC